MLDKHREFASRPKESGRARKLGSGQIAEERFIDDKGDEVSSIGRGSWAAYIGGGVNGSGVVASSGEWDAISPTRIAELCDRKFLQRSELCNNRLQSVSYSLVIVLPASKLFEMSSSEDRESLRKQMQIPHCSRLSLCRFHGAPGAFCLKGLAPLLPHPKLPAN